VGSAMSADPSGRNPVSRASGNYSATTRSTIPATACQLTPGSRVIAVMSIARARYATNSSSARVKRCSCPPHGACFAVTPHRGYAISHNGAKVPSSALPCTANRARRVGRSTVRDGQSRYSAACGSAAERQTPPRCHSASRHWRTGPRPRSLGGSWSHAWGCPGASAFADTSTESTNPVRPQPLSARLTRSLTSPVPWLWRRRAMPRQPTIAGATGSAVGSKFVRLEVRVRPRLPAHIEYLARIMRDSGVWDRNTREDSDGGRRGKDTANAKCG